MMRAYRAPTRAEVELTDQIESLRRRREALDSRARSAAAFLEELLRRKITQRTDLRQQMLRQPGRRRAAPFASAAIGRERSPR